jgi:glycosyltransferase involved in cell wall biosynthesis
MKILFCANIFESGVVGPARFAENLLKINDLYKNEHQVFILTADAKQSGPFVFKFQYNCPKLIRILDFLLLGFAYWSRVRRLHASHQFDVVLFGNAIYCLVAMSLGVGLPVVGMVNDDHVAMVNFRNFRKVLGGKGLLFVRVIERIATRKLQTVISCSDYLKRFLVKQYHLDTKKVHRLYQGIDNAGVEFQPDRFQSLPNVKLVFIKHRHDLGRLSDLLKALGLLPAYRFHFTIIGPPIAEKNKVKESLKNSTNIHLNFIGPATQSIVHQQLDENDILCIPSSLEALGLANVEGMVHGIQIVSTRVGGIPEVLAGGNYGWLCEPCDPVSLANAIRDCIEASPKTRIKMSEGGFAHFDANFKVKTMLENLLQILKKAVAEHYAQ